MSQPGSNSSGSYALLASVQVLSAVAPDVATASSAGQVSLVLLPVRTGRGAVMTVLCVLSLKGSPGVTTLSCLLAATWPTAGPVTVVEADRAGGDLAARFGLSSTVGWSSLAAAARRGGEDSPLEPHLQLLPGGLAVLVSAGGDHLPRPGLPRRGHRAGGVGPGGGRSRQGHPDVARTDRLGTVLAPRAATARWSSSAGSRPARCTLRTHAAALLDCTAGRLGLVVVGAGLPSGDDVGSFAGIRSLGDVPRDPAAAAVASGASGAGSAPGAVPPVGVGTSDRRRPGRTRR